MRLTIFASFREYVAVARKCEAGLSANALVAWGQIARASAELH